MKQLPDCNKCDADATLEKVRSDGVVTWCVCTCCSATVLIDADGVIVASNRSERRAKAEEA